MDEPALDITSVPWYSRRGWVSALTVSSACDVSSFSKSFEDTGRALLPQLQFALEKCIGLAEKILTEPTRRYGVLLTILLSSNFHTRDWKVHAVSIAGKILSKNPHFGTGILYLKLLARQRGKDMSRRIAGVCMDTHSEEEIATDPRRNASWGEFLQSKAQDRIMQGCGDLDGALRQLGGFRYFHEIPTAIGNYEMERHHFIKGRIYRWKSCFRAATDISDQSLNFGSIQLNETGCNLIKHLAGTLCEQRQFHVAERNVREAIIGCESLCEKGMKRQGLKTLGCLRLSLAETLVSHTLVKELDSVEHRRFQNLKEAESLFTKFKVEYEEGREQRSTFWSSEMSYLRVCMGKALACHLKSHWHEASCLWEEARKPADICKDKVTKFIPMIIDYC